MNIPKEKHNLYSCKLKFTVIYQTCKMRCGNESPHCMFQDSITTFPPTTRQTSYLLLMRIGHRLCNQAPSSPSYQSLSYLTRCAVVLQQAQPSTRIKKLTSCVNGI